MSSDRLDRVPADADLLREARRGSVEALNRLLARSMVPLEAFLNRQIGRKLRRQVSIADLRQDVLLQALDGLKRLPEKATEEDFDALLRRHARWAVLNAVRGGRRHAGESLARPSPSALFDPPAPSASQGSVTRADARHTVRELVAGLDPQLAEVVSRRMEGAKFEEIGAELGIGVAAARKRFLQASRRLRERAERLGL